MDVIQATIAIMLPMILLSLLYMLGKKSKRKTGREPYVSGHQFPVMRIPYSPMWLYYLSFFILWDIILLFILFTAAEVSLVLVTSLILLSITMFLYPIRVKRGVKK